MSGNPDDIGPSEAGDLLKGVEGAERRTRQLLTYARAGDYMILWGVIWLLGYGIADQLYPYTQAIWLSLDVLGIAGTGWITYRAVVCGDGSPERRFVFLKPMLCIVVLIGFGMFWLNLLHVHGREQNLFWPMLCGSILFCVGLWAGRVLSIGSGAVVALAIGGYFFAGPWFSLWIAVVTGGALVLGGLWLRR